MRTIVILPTYDEADNVRVLLPRLRAVAPEADILVVDDGSPDGTAAIVEELGRELGRIEVLRRTEKSGLGNAYRAGFGVALDRGYEVVVQMDADLSHDPASLPDLLAAVARGADAAIGSRYVDGGTVPGWPLHRRALSQVGNRYASVALHLGIGDATSGYRAYSADILRRIDVTTTTATGYGFMIELARVIARKGGTMVEVPIRFEDRVRGTSKMSGRIIAEAMLLVTLWGIEERVQRAAGQRRSRRTGSVLSGRHGSEPNSDQRCHPSPGTTTSTRPSSSKR